MLNQLNLRTQLHRHSFDLENTNQELKSDLKDLYINSAMQIDVSGNRKSVVVHVPYRLRKAYRKIHVRLVRELEKKFSGKESCINRGRGRIRGYRRRNFCGQ
ncbi:hypothetical protein Dsin_014125 [Dipteronia sinensis]|uniref:40S ribosomal protein S7 n=1 Tax=Dipteronia sinensis TaxID=43782 RepID=A0AAE0AM88_9ROSI|nr:hypothetical protein Dsin_014125 [Dipteronia sinensis]